MPLGCGGLLVVAFLCFVSNGLTGASAGFDITEVATSQSCLGYVAQMASSYVDQTALDVLFKTYFEFDESIFAMIVGFNMVAFISGYSIRRVIRLLSSV